MINAEHKAIIFDMDGTLADFYSYPDWLECLLAEDASPYIEAEPLLDMEELCAVLNTLREMGWKVVITSWLSKGSSRAFDAKVREAKRAWLDYYDVPADEIHLVKYGTTKANCTRKAGGYQVLFDDNAQVRAGWHLGAAHDVHNIINDLLDLMEMEG